MDVKTNRVLPGIPIAIQTFMQPLVAARMTALIESGTIKSHRKLMTMMAHFAGFKPDVIVRTAGDDMIIKILKEAVGRDSRRSRFELLSESPDLDATVLSLEDLIPLLLSSNYGLFAVLDPHRFAAFRGEDPKSTLLLQKGQVQRGGR